MSKQQRKLFANTQSQSNKSRKGSFIQSMQNHQPINNAPVHVPAPRQPYTDYNQRTELSKKAITLAVGFLNSQFPNAGAWTRQAAASWLVAQGPSAWGQIQTWYNKRQHPDRNFLRNNNNNNNDGGNVPTPAPGGGSLGRSENVFRSSNTNLSYALSPAPNPKSVKLATGIKPNTFVNDYMQPKESVCTSCHISAVSLQMPTIAVSPTNPLATYYEKTILFDLQTSVQALVTYSIDLTTFSTANIASAFNDAIYALQVYYYYSSILSYESDSRNKNAGLINLRGLVDANTLSDYVQLGKRLEDLPIPPRIVDWVKYMSGIYFSSNSQGSAIIKLGLTPASFTTTPAISLCKLAYDRLVLTNNLPVWTLLRRAKPKWRIGRLYDIPTTPVYDPQFCTIFANLQSSNRVSGTTAFLSSVANADTAMAYNSYANRLDGLAFAMTTVQDVALNTGIPGICTPYIAASGYPDNRYSYYEVSGVKGFYPIVTYSYLGLSRQETYAYINPTAYTLHLYGADKCQNVTGNALMLTAQTVMDFLFNAGGNFSRYTKYLG